MDYEQDFFPIFQECPTLDGDLPCRIERYAQRRIDRSTTIEAIRRTGEPNIPAIRHGDITLGERLGKGAFSMVLTVKNIRKSVVQFDNESKNTKLALKVLRPSLLQSPQLFSVSGADLYKEGIIMATLQHPNIVKTHAWAKDGVSTFANGRNDGFFLVVDMLDTTLTDCLQNWRRQSGGLFRPLARRRTKIAKTCIWERIDAILQLASAVTYLQKNRMLHRDLKPDNIGFQHGVLKLFDFDIARIVPDGRDCDTFKMTAMIGSPRYMAPEIARGEEYNLSADIYSFSLLCHEMLTLEKPFAGMSSDDVSHRVHFGGLRPMLPSTLSLPLQELLSNCWSPSLPLRPLMPFVEDLLQDDLQALSILQTPNNCKTAIIGSDMTATNASSTRPTKKGGGETALSMREQSPRRFPAALSFFLLRRPKIAAAKIA